MNRDRTDAGTRVDGDALRGVMRRLPSPVTVVTARGPSGARGITIGSFTSTSLDPPLICFNVEKEAQMHDVLASASRYAVHILGEDQAYLSDHFAIPDRTGEEQFASVAYHLGPHGMPILDGVLAVLHCAHYAAYEAGDHSIFVGEVVDIEEGASGGPLLYFNRAYRRVGSAVSPSVVPSVKRASSDAP